MIKSENESDGLSHSMLNVWKAVLLLLAGLALTILAVIYTRSAVDATAKREFDFACGEIQRRVLDRRIAHEQVLRSGAAFFNDTDGVTREEWRFFAERQKVDQFLPGIQGLGFALLIPREKLAQHVRAVQAEGFPAYRVFPENEREVYSSIIYLEPFTNRNLRAFGYDMLSEPVRRAAMEQACDRDDAVLSGRVRLLQETDQDVQAGTLMFVPVYRMGMPCATVDQRRASLLGWVYSPYRMTDLMRGVLGGWDFENSRRIRLEVFDGAQATPEALLYDSHPGGEPYTGSASHMSLRSPMVASGRTWTLRFTRAEHHAYALDYGKVWLVLFAGTSISLLLFGLLLNLLNTRVAWHTSRRLAAVVRASEGKYRRLVENSPEVIYTLSPDGVITFVSPSWTALLGHPADQVVGRPLQLFVHPDAHAECLGWLRRMTETGQRCGGVEYRVQHCDGTWRWQNASAVPVFDEEGTIVGFEGTAIDITERVRLEELLREKDGRIRQSEKMEAIGQLAGGIAHDFNNVLCGIIGYADMSLEHAQQDHILEDNLRKILKAADRAKQLVKQILTFSRRGTTPQSAVSVRPVLEEVLQLLRASIPSSVIMKTELDRDTRSVLADSTRLHEAFLNLANNAVHAMRRQGTLTVRLRKENVGQKAYGRIGEIPPGEYTVVEVADTGCGMEASTLSKAFEPFFTTKAVGEGTGMGLSVVLGVVQSLGGDIQVESEWGKGTTFRIYLPATGEPEATVPGAVATVSGAVATDCRGGTETILFVDDELLLVEMAQGLLTGLGYSVIVLNDSLAALELVKTKGAEIDLLITDQTMPGMTGIELAKAVRQLRSDLPIILCSGFSREINPKRIAAIGISRVAMKPFTPREFGALIRDVLDGKKEFSHGEDTGH